MNRKISTINIFQDLIDKYRKSLTEEESLLYEELGKQFIMSDSFREILINHSNYYVGDLPKSEILRRDLFHKFAIFIEMKIESLNTANTKYIIIVPIIWFMYIAFALQGLFEISAFQKKNIALTIAIHSSTYSILKEYHQKKISKINKNLRNLKIYSDNKKLLSYELKSGIYHNLNR